MPASECGGKRNPGPSKRIDHEADGIESMRKSRWGLNGNPTGKRGVERNWH